MVITHKEVFKIHTIYKTTTDNNVGWFYKVKKEGAIIIEENQKFYFESEMDAQDAAIVHIEDKFI